MGTPDFAVVSLRQLVEANRNVIAVVTTPDRPKGRGQQMSPSPVKVAATEFGIPVLQPEKLKSQEFISNLKELKPDLILVVAFRILPAEIFTIPPLGTVNLHGSLLPRYRGAAPINWALINGDKVTGVTTFFIQQKVDTGNVIDQAEIPIHDNMTAGELHDIMAKVGAELLVETTTKIAAGKVVTKSQDESLVSKAPKIFRDDCLVNFDRPASEVHNFIRGLSPYPAAHTWLDGKMIRLYDSRMTDSITLDYPISSVRYSPTSEVLEIQCNPGIVAVSSVQLAGKKRMPVADFLNGYTLKDGTLLSKPA